MDLAALFKKTRPAFFTIQMERDAIDALVDDLTYHAEDHDADAYRIRGAKARTRRAFFDELGAVMRLRSSFGENWDAFNDVAYSHSWMPGTLFVITDAHLLFADESEQDLRNLVELFDRCNRFYLTPPYDKGDESYTGFHALFQTDAEHAAELLSRLSAVGAEHNPL